MVLCILGEQALFILLLSDGSWGTLPRPRVIDDALWKNIGWSYISPPSEELRGPQSGKCDFFLPVVMKIRISGMSEAKPHLRSYEWIILISFWVVRNQFVLHRNAICSWSLCMRLEFFPLLGICFIMEWKFELIFLDIFHLMHFNVCLPQISASVERIIPIFFSYSL